MSYNDERVDKISHTGIQTQMEQLVQDLENIELMNQWSKEDAEMARRELEEAKRRQSQNRGSHH